MWEIFAYHNSEALEGIFNAIAAIMASGTYLSAIAAVGFCGFVAAMVAYMFQPEKLVGWKWLVSVVLIYGVLFVPRVTVAVVDKTGGTPTGSSRTYRSAWRLSGADKHHWQCNHRASRLPSDTSRARGTTRGTVLPAERPDVRESTIQRRGASDPGSRSSERHHQLRQ